MKSSYAKLIIICITIACMLPIIPLSNYDQENRMKVLKGYCPTLSEDCLNRTIIEPSPILILYPMIVLLIGFSSYLYFDKNQTDITQNKEAKK